MDNNFSNNSIAVSPTLSQEGVATNSPDSDKITDKLPIAIDSLPAGLETERPNKYLYPPFAGYSGERYLDSLLMQILPSALWRTWHYAVDFQAPGNLCYVGATRISQRVKPGVRKIEIDLHELETRGLMRRYATRLPVTREYGSLRNEAVIVKDFSALYALAYEYHLWTGSPEYIPPERAYTGLILADQRLYDKVIRFDNYRRLLVCAKPGRKAQLTATQLSYHCQFPLDDQAVFAQHLAQTIRTEDPNTNNYINTPANISSPYRESRKEEIISENNSISTKDLEAGTIGNQSDTQNIETEVVSHNTDTLSTKQEKTVENEVSKSKSVETQQEKEIFREAAKEEISGKKYTIEDLKNNPMAMTAFLLDLNAQQQRQQEKMKRSRKQNPQRKRRGTPERLATTMVYIAQTLGGNPKFQQSDITRLTKMYWAATQIFNGFNNAWFLDIVQEVFLTVCHTRGVKRRVPYFFKCLEEKLELTPDELVFIRSQEPLYTDGVDIHSFKASLIKAYEKSGTSLEYLEWVQQNYLA